MCNMLQAPQQTPSAFPSCIGPTKPDTRNPTAQLSNRASNQMLRPLLLANYQSPKRRRPSNRSSKNRLLQFIICAHFYNIVIFQAIQPDFAIVTQKNRSLLRPPKPCFQSPKQTYLLIHVSRKICSCRAVHPLMLAAALSAGEFSSPGSIFSVKPNRARVCLTASASFCRNFASFSLKSSEHPLAIEASSWESRSRTISVISDGLRTGLP